MRSFEVPGVGGIGLFPMTPDHNFYFENGTEIFLYNDMESCKRNAKAILKMSEPEAGEVRLAARKKSMDAGYSYKGRALQVLQELQKLIS
jgi:spore maturation protein CgeB